MDGLPLDSLSFPQPTSSEPSPQSLTPSHFHQIGTHCLLVQRNIQEWQVFWNHTTAYYVSQLQKTEKPYYTSKQTVYSIFTKNGQVWTSHTNIWPHRWRLCWWSYNRSTVLLIWTWSCTLILTVIVSITSPWTIYTAIILTLKNKNTTYNQIWLLATFHSETLTLQLPNQFSKIC